MPIITRLPKLLNNIHFRFEEAVFEHRNKDYGAYELRKSYDRYINRGMLIANVLFVTCSLAVFFYFKFTANNEPVYQIVDFKTSDFSLEEVKIPSVQQKLPPPPKNQAVNENAPPVVKEDVHEKETDKKEEVKPIVESKENSDGKTETTTPTETISTVSSDTSGKHLYSNEIFMKVEIPATFPGGAPALGQFLGRNIQYPDYAKENKVDGIIYVHMVINTDGSISDLRIYKGIEESCNQEVMRVMKLSPNWIPARQKGAFVRQRLIVPIRFKVH